MPNIRQTEFKNQYILQYLKELHKLMLLNGKTNLKDISFNFIILYILIPCSNTYDFASYETPQAKVMQCNAMPYSLPSGMVDFQ